MTDLDSPLILTRILLDIVLRKEENYEPALKLKTLLDSGDEGTITYLRTLKGDQYFAHLAQDEEALYALAVDMGLEADQVERSTKFLRDFKKRYSTDPEVKRAVSGAMKLLKLKEGETTVISGAIFTNLISLAMKYPQEAEGIYTTVEFLTTAVEDYDTNEDVDINDE